MPKFTIKHITHYRYDEPVHDSANQLMLYPISDDFQDVIQHTLNISGKPKVATHTDYYGNTAGSFTNYEAHSELRIESVLVVNVRQRPAPENSLFVENQWEKMASIRYEAPYIDFLRQEPFENKKEVEAVVLTEETRLMNPFQVARSFCSYVFEHFKYIQGVTTVETTVSEIWKMKSGVCQDFAHILLVMLRIAGIPARYVSGYICPNQNGMRGEGATHAWVEAYIPEYGWLGLDPTNNCLTEDQHVRLAVGRSFVDVSPVRGTYKGTANHSLEVKVVVSYENDPKALDENPGLSELADSQTVGNSYRKFKQMQQIQQQQ